MGWLIIVLGAVVYWMIAVVVAHKFTSARRRTPILEASYESLAPQRITFQPRGEQKPLHLAAWYIPAPPHSRAVIFVHGKDASRGYEFKTDSFELAQAFVQRGFSVLMLDLRGHGESDPARMTYGKLERRDVLGAVDWLLAQGYAPASIGLLGASMGAVSVIGAAADDCALGAVVADSAFGDYGDVLRDQFVKQTHLPRIFLPGVLLVGRLLTGVRLGKFRPIEDAALLVSTPTLIIHAINDPFIPMYHAEALAEVALAGLWITRGDSHLASFREDFAAYAEKVVNFFDFNLAPRRVEASERMVIHNEGQSRAA